MQCHSWPQAAIPDLCRFERFLAVRPQLEALPSWMAHPPAHGVGGQCNHGSIEQFRQSSDPNTQDYFLQRVIAAGYQDIPRHFSPSSDSNTYLRFGTLSIDGVTAYLGQLAYSPIPNPAWPPVLGLQHQLDSAMLGVTIEEFVDKESVTTW